MISQWIFYGFSTMASNLDSLNMSLLNNIETRFDCYDPYGRIEKGF